MKARYLFNTIKETANTKNGRIVVLTGARQTGKTTIVKTGLKDYVYLSIEDPVNSSVLQKIVAKQWKELYPKAILDEVQKHPQLIESIKSVYDQWDEPRYILLGSSQLLLLQKVRESLAGRCVIKEIYPLTLPELQTNDWKDEVSDSVFQTLIKGGDMPALFPDFKLHPDYSKKMEAWNYYQKFGGYPALCDRETENEKKEWLSQYVRTYLERDVRDLAEMRNLEPYKKLQEILALQTGNLLNISNLSKLIGVSAPTVSRYVEYLGISYQTILLPSWEKNMGKRLVKSPKVHYIDNGVLQAVINKYGKPNGNEFESIVVSEIYKQAKQVSDRIRFYHLRTADGREVDMIVETEDGYYAFEIKMADRVSHTDARHLRNLAEIVNDKPLIHSFVLSNDTETMEFGEGITAVHAGYFLG